MNSVIKISKQRNRLVGECLLHTRQMLRFYSDSEIWKGHKRYAH